MIRAGPASRGRGLVPALVALAALLCSSSPASAEPEAKRVVVIYPDESDGAPGLILVNRALHETFASLLPGRVEIRNEYVDTGRLGDVDFMRAQVSLLRRKYAGRKVDLVIAGLSAGLDFAVKFREELFPGVPVVFVAVDEREVKSRRLPPDVIGAPIQMDLNGTLDLALRLQPETRRVFVVTGNTPFDLEWEAEARRTFGEYEGRLQFAYFTGLPMDELLGRVATLPERSIIYYLHIHQDGAGKPFYPADALERLAEKANVPIYGHVNTYVGRGAVGGRVFCFEAEGVAAASIGSRILSGERPDSIDVGEVGKNAYVFDWRQLRRWGIDEQNLPPGSIVLHREVTFWESYQWYLIGGAAVCLAQALLIAALLLQRARVRRAERLGRESEARFQLMADAAPILIWACGVDKKRTYFNRTWLDFTGRPLECELGDGWAEGVHPDDRPGCLEVVTSHLDSHLPFEMVYRLRRHDGEYRWVLARGVPYNSPAGAFAGYIGACSDITEQKQAVDGLGDSRRQLQLLTGRLLAAQEDERRRIARELHDDLNQSLALVSLEMETLVGTPPPPAEAAERLRELSAQIKELSSSVHDLSHQLHPAKLEQLGLVAAVRGLCQELAGSHGLNVAFRHDAVPADVPADVALCLYRIVQESLWNVVKHSGTRHATMTLRGTGDAVRLRVADDGRGFDPGRTDGGLGLVSMRERLNLVAGVIEIDTRPAGGTRLDVRVPLPRERAAAPGSEPELVLEHTS